MTTDHRERAFEETIEATLLAHGYSKVEPNSFDRAAAIFPTEALSFLQESQAQTWRDLERIHGVGLESKLLEALTKALDARGTVDVLRHGLKFYGKTLQLAYWRPETRLNPQAASLYAKNRLGETRQLKFSPNSEQSIDIALSVNGLPVVTIELKNLLTGQSVVRRRPNTDSTEPSRSIVRWKTGGGALCSRSGPG